MAERFRLSLAQLNPTVGDLDGNAAIARATWAEAKAAGADMVAFPEMFLTGYQLQDLVKKPAFAMDVQRVLTRGGFGPRLRRRAPLSVSADRCRGGAQALQRVFRPCKGGNGDGAGGSETPPAELQRLRRKKRYYHAGDPSGPVRVRPAAHRYPDLRGCLFEDVTETLAETGAEILLVPNGSPYHRGKMDMRQAIMVSRVIETGLPLVYLNLIGGQDDQVFDGGSFVLNPHGVLDPPDARLSNPCSPMWICRNRGRKGWQAVAGARKSALPDTWRPITASWVEALRDYCSPKVRLLESRPGPSRAAIDYRPLVGGHSHRRMRWGPEKPCACVISSLALYLA